MLPGKLHYCSDVGVVQPGAGAAVRDFGGREDSNCIVWRACACIVLAGGGRNQAAKWSVKRNGGVHNPKPNKVPGY